MSNRKQVWPADPEAHACTEGHDQHVQGMDVKACGSRHMVIHVFLLFLLPSQVSLAM